MKFSTAVKDGNICSSMHQFFRRIGECFPNYVLGATWSQKWPQTSLNILLIWKVEGRWRPVFQQSSGISRYHNIMHMVIFHYFNRTSMNLRIIKKLTRLGSSCKSIGIIQTNNEGYSRIPLWRWLDRLNQNEYHICEQKVYFGHWQQVLVWHPPLDEPIQ